MPTLLFLAGRNAAKPSQATGLTDVLAGRNAYPTAPPNIEPQRGKSAGESADTTDAADCIGSMGHFAAWG